MQAGARTIIKHGRLSSQARALGLPQPDLVAHILQRNGDISKLFLQTGGGAWAVANCPTLPVTAHLRHQGHPVKDVRVRMGLHAERLGFGMFGMSCNPMHYFADAAPAGSR
jgi:hypothetical protein